MLRSWSEMDNSILHLRYSEKVSPKLIARELCRTRAAVIARACERRITTRHRPTRSETLPRGEVRLSEIAAITRLHFGLAVGEITSSRRTIRIARPRQVAMKMAIEFTNLSLPKIGVFFHRDHTTVIHAERRIAELCREDEELAAHVEAIRTRIVFVGYVRVAGRAAKVAWSDGIVRVTV